jgi:hypothetical protein
MPIGKNYDFHFLTSFLLFCINFHILFFLSINGHNGNKDYFKEGFIIKDLFYSLYQADSEEEVEKIINTHPILSNPDNWKPYGGDINNFSTFQNQQSEAVPALVEKLTNAIDAILIKEIKLKGIDPESFKAPRNARKAIELIFGVKDGTWENADEKFRRSVAERIQLITTGDKKEPSITVYDDGEGQHPDDFERTFLSLHKGNKVKIPFVQGKYNMGSTGAVVFCGENNYQLIASKKVDELFSDENNEFGFTLVRLHKLSEKEESIFKSSWYEYFTVDGKIARFPIDSLEIGLNKNKKFNSGSIVKMYSYDLPPKIRSSITFDFYRELNQILFHPSIPILLTEGRKEYQAENPHIVLEGNKIRLLKDKSNKVQESFTFQIENDDFGRLEIEAYLFKPDVNRRDYIRNHSVLFTVNGQAQGFETRSFISQELNFPMLKESLLLHIDCSYLKTSYRNDLFMSSRDRLKNSSKKQYLLNEIKNMIKANKQLRKIHDERRNSLLRGDHLKEDTIEKIASRLPIQQELYKLLKKTPDGEKNRKKNKEKKQKKEEVQMETKFHPSIFELATPDVKKIPLGGRGYVVFKTDAPEDFFTRENEKGHLKTLIINHKRGEGKIEQYELDEAKKVFDVGITGPFLGQILVSLEPQEGMDLLVNDVLELVAKLVCGDHIIDCYFSISIDNKVGQAKRQKKKNKKRDVQLKLPKPIQVSEENWSTYQWNGEDVIDIIVEQDELGEQVVSAIAVNMDCNHFKKYLSASRLKTESQLKTARDQFFSVVYFQTLFQFGTLKNVLTKSNITLELDEILEEFFKGFTGFLVSYHMNNESIKMFAEQVG